MSVLPFPPRGRWVWDARGHDRAVRVSAHPRAGLVNLSVWRDDICVGTVRLPPAEVAGLVAGLTESLARLAEEPVEVDPRADGEEKLRDLERRLGELEARLTPRRWRAVVAGVAGRTQDVWRGAVSRA